ncbi:MAG: hypothetical protein KF729_33085 [Sandaracinaceae bacterium]|nr:hypothetical protein [Sandaracinaceae bacterium]
MQRLAACFALASLLFAPAARAQTLTIELEAELEAPPPARPDAPAVVIVRPEHDARVAPTPVVYDAPVATPAPASTSGSDPELWGGLSLHLEGMDLSGLDLRFGRPRVEALGGLALGADWSGRERLREVFTGGASLHLGMRAGGFLRGPELRFGLGGGQLAEADGLAAQGADGFTFAPRSVFFLRAELAIGLQLPLGPVTPYLVATGSVGVAWVDLEVREARLGGLGTETIEAGLFGAGLEAGLDVTVDRGMAMGFALRATFAGAPAIGGAYRVSWGGE